MFLIFCFAFSVIIGGWLDRYERKGRRRLRKRRFEEAALYFAEVMSTMKIMPGQKNGGFGFGLFAGKVQDGNFQEFQRENEEQY